MDLSISSYLRHFASGFNAAMYVTEIAGNRLTAKRDDSLFRLEVENTRTYEISTTDRKTLEVAQVVNDQCLDATGALNLRKSGFHMNLACEIARLHDRLEGMGRYDPLLEDRLNYYRQNWGRDDLPLVPVYGIETDTHEAHDRLGFGTINRFPCGIVLEKPEAFKPSDSQPYS